MKKINKIIFWFLAIFIAVFIASSVYIALYGKKIVESQIEQNLKMKASIGSIGLSIPFSVHLTNLEIGNLLRVEKISATPSILALIAGKMVLSGLTIIEPVINIEQASDGILNLPKLGQKENQPPFYLTGLVVKNGKIIFSDNKITPEGLKIVIDKIDANISRAMIPPTSLNAKFKLTASFVSPDNKNLGSAYIDGWIDLGPKDMDATFELKGIDAVYLQAYLGELISSRKLLSAKVNFLAHLSARNNNLTIDSNFRLFNLVYAQGQEAPKEAEAPKEGEAWQEARIPSIDAVRSALDLFTDKEGNLNLAFSLETKLDNPQINVSQLKKATLKAALINLTNQSPESIFEKVNKNINQFEEIGKELKKIFKNK